jgi:hypothetical protein
MCPRGRPDTCLPCIRHHSCTPCCLLQSWRWPCTASTNFYPGSRHTCLPRIVRNRWRPRTWRMNPGCIRRIARYQFQACRSRCRTARTRPLATHTQGGIRTCNQWRVTSQHSPSMSLKGIPSTYSSWSRPWQAGICRAHTARTPCRQPPCMCLRRRVRSVPCPRTVRTPRCICSLPHCC